jgi:glycosyltransferase involved in cell wall biosynthesis
MASKPSSLVIDFLLEDLFPSGGREVCLTYAAYLKATGHDVRILTCQAGDIGRPSFDVPIQTIAFKDVPSACTSGLTVFSVHDFAQPLFKAGKTKPVFFCQGAVWEDRDQKIARAKDKSADGWLARLHWGRRLRRHQNRLDQIERAYQLPIPRIVVSEALQRKVNERFGGEIHLVPNGIDHTVFRPSETPHTPYPIPHTLRIISVGSSNLRVKRVEDLLEAVALLKKPNGFPLPLHLVRVSPDEMSPREKELGVTDEFYTKISREKLAELYRSCQVLVATSDQAEGFGLPPVEAMACGVPVILTKIEAFQTYDTPADYARFVDVGDVKDIATAIKELAPDEPRRKRLVKRGIEVAKKYDLARSCRRFEETLEKIETTDPSAEVLTKADEHR